MAVSKNRDMTGDYKRCRLLWMAVLDRAKDDLSVHGAVQNNECRSRRRIRAEAKQWFKSDSTGGCSFLWVCTILDLNPGYVRDKIFKMDVSDVSADSGLGLRIKRWRETRGINQTGMAKKTGCSNSVISMIENGHITSGRWIQVLAGVIKDNNHAQTEEPRNCNESP